MSPWLTAKELAGLPGMLDSERRTRDRLLQLGIPNRPRAGRGGGREFEAAALPFETRQALMLTQVAQAGTAIAASAESAATEGFSPPPASPIHPPATLPVPPERPASQADRAVADCRVILVNHVLQLAQTNGTTRACQMLAMQLATEKCSAELLQAARTANQRARTSAVSDRTLFRYLGVYQKDGWWGLLPATTNAPTPLLGKDVATVLAKYCSRDPKFRNLTAAAKEVTKALATQDGRDYESWKQLYAKARRALPNVNKVDLIKARHSGAERAAKLPFKRRDTSVLKPLDVWLIDGHTFKAKVRHPDHGAPFAPEVTICIDAATRLICGWSVALSENVIAVGDALRHAVGNCGIPALIYSDNGAGETAKQMDCPVTGIVARLGAEHRTGIPGHPQGHGLIERSWRTHMINCARQFASFQGSDVDSRSLRNVSMSLAKEQRALKRAENTGEVIQLSNKAPSWAQFIDAVGQSVADYNTQHRHRALPKNAQGKHLTPAEFWQQSLDTTEQHIPGPQELRMLFMPATLRVAQRGEVRFLNQVYFSPELMAVDGEQVRVHYDIHNPNYVLVFDGAGQFVCEAAWNANRIDYFPKPVIEMAREKRVRGVVKRRQAQIDTAMRELQGQHDAGAPLALVQPADAVVLVPTIPAQASQALPVAQTTNARPFFDAPSYRYEWLMSHRKSWEGDDAAWVASYVASEDYAELRDYYASRGVDWKNEDVGFKSAR